MINFIYIPSEYWNEKISGFKTFDKEKNIPKSSNFFLIWDKSLKSISDLEYNIKKALPEIPAEKLISCEIHLAFPQNDKNLFKIEKIIGKIVPISPALNFLFNLEIPSLKEVIDKNILGNSIIIWSYLTKFVYELLNKYNFIPILIKEKEKIYRSKWKLLLKSQQDNERFRILINNAPWYSYNIPINFIQKNNTYYSDGLLHPSYLFAEFMDKTCDYLIRFILKKSKFNAFNDFYSSEIKKEKAGNKELNWDYRFLKALISQDNTFKIRGFHESIIPSLINNWVKASEITAFAKGISIAFRLDYPEKDDKNWNLKIGIIMQENGEFVPIDKIFDYKSKEREKISNYFENDAQLIEFTLKALGTAANIYAPINRALEGTITNNIVLNSSEIMDFLRYPRYLLVQNGFNVILPDVFTQGGKRRLSAKIIIHSKGKKEKRKLIKGAIPQFRPFEINSLLDFRWKISIEDQELTDEEFYALIKEDKPLINWRGNWILIDQKDLDDLKKIFKEKEKSSAIMQAKGKITFMEAVKLGLSGELRLEDSDSKYEVILEGDIGLVLDKIKNFDTFQKISVPKSFNGSLRPYQEVALNWMANMCSLNFGVCLADDMGLGKTIQVIALLLHFKEIYPENFGSTLIICPTSVLFNWIRELQKFAPSLDIVLHHGPNRPKNANQIIEYLKPHKIILTSYGTIRKDIEFFETINFGGIIIDESQNIKNYNSQQTQAILKLQSNYRICLSGTPIENRLMELWTLFEFLNPGLLGTRTEFQRKYVIPIERFQDKDAIDKLKKIIAPFIMRRVKSDKKIINDLPEKNEIKVFIDLTDEQIKLYRAAIDNAFKELESPALNSQKKRGIVFKLLMSLKQICNHPAQYLKEKILKDMSYHEIIKRSNKLKRLIEMTDEVIENGEKVLIFTQFKQMGDIILDVLSKKYGFKILYFHGSVPANKRKEIVDEFQSKESNSSPIMILSLKAGGTGLNLTRGTTVIHYDRWWNPAVENQATDRAFRIGQKQRVNVYKFVSIGTIEEKIDDLLENKKELADKIVVSTGESWISDLSENKLKELLKLEI
ncbi:MAG: DEAD/DEAH box helicase [Promethearchaeota archaeon]